MIISMLRNTFINHSLIFSIMNFIDFMAILPVFLTMILEGLEDMRVIFVVLKVENNQMFLRLLGKLEKLSG